MELHFEKFPLITTSGQPASVCAPDGTVIHSKPSMEYLGSISHGGGQADHEISKIIAIARAEFYTLVKIWTHSALTWKQELRIFVSLVESKLLYAMAALILTAVQREQNSMAFRINV